MLDSESPNELPAKIALATNVGQILSAAAELYPDGMAVAESPRRPGSGKSAYRTITFSQLERRANAVAARIQQLNVPVGARLALLVPPGIDFVTLVFGLYKAAVVSVLVDPGIGRSNLVRCLSETDPLGMVGIRKAHLARWLFRRRFPNCRYNFIAESRGWLGIPGIFDESAAAAESYVPPRGDGHEPASIIFTTGSTGPAKGVLYRHRNFIEQAVEISRYFQLPPGGVDISGFPLFALFNAATATTTVFPRMDFTRPAKVNPARLVATVHDWSATQSFGSPALWNTVSRYCQQRKIRLESIRTVLTAGAPVPVHVLERVRSVIADHGEVFTPYGATEALPVACASSSEVLGEQGTGQRTRDGWGTCVGGHFPKMHWRVIPIDDGPIEEMGDTTSLPANEIGELIVRGPVVTDQYVTRLDANRLSKIRDGAGFWHRMGDLGYLDSENRFWFCGRKSHRVQTAHGTMFPIPCEAIINGHPSVYRSALVGIGNPPNQVPVIIVEPWPDRFPRGRRQRAQLLDELHALARNHQRTRPIKTILIHRSLPVDIRHNSKIFREKLAIWATRKLNPRFGKPSSP